MKSHYINGEWKESKGDKISSFNPASGELVWEGKKCTETEIDEAVMAARNAFEAWSELSVEERLKYLEAYAEKLSEAREEFSEIISKETGKPLWESNMEVGGMINKLKISKQAFEERAGTVEKDIPIGKAVIRHKPHGVMAVFGPYNFPGHLPNGHIIPSLLAGNTVVFKPSGMTPLVGQKMVELWDATGIPKGVINLIQGRPSGGGLSLSNHPEIDGLLFTGSTETGCMLHKEFADHPQKIIALEMGGNNPLVVSEVDDLEATAYTVIQSAYITAGQRCTCARRLILCEDKLNADEFIETLSNMIQGIKVGTYTDSPEPFMGSVISNKDALWLLDEQKKLIDRGGKALVEMKLLKEGTGLLSPGLIDVSDIDREDKELFGPVLQIIRVPNFEAAIKEANNTSFGLSAGLISKNHSDYEHFLKKVRAGIINFNQQLTGASSSAPFGGVGCSGNHRPSAYYAADYCSYPVASLEAQELKLPETLSPGIDIKLAEKA